MSTLLGALLGVIAAIEWLAAAYALIDYAFDSTRYRRRMGQRLGLLTLAVITVGAALPAGPRQAFVLAACAYAVFHVLCYATLRWIAVASWFKTPPIE
jgi:hypothetical protein